jgi:hypothetical protein
LRVVIRRPEMPSGDDPQVRKSRSIPVRGWKIRFDSPPVWGLSQRAEKGDILALFQAWEGAFGNDRRQNARYTPTETQAWVGWWKMSRFIVSHAELVNLSKGGALVHLNHKPPTSQPVWICLGAPHPMDYVQARVLDAARGPADKEFHARLEFHSPCPASFFLAAGHRVEDASPSPSPSPPPPAGTDRV